MSHITEGTSTLSLVGATDLSVAPGRVPCANMCSMTAQGGAYSQFRRALDRGNFMLAWALAAELPKVPLGDGLALLLLARDVEPARFDRAVPRWHARLGSERPLSIAEAQLALAALNALPGVGAAGAAQALAAILRQHGLDREARALDAWAAARDESPRRSNQ